MKKLIAAAIVLAVASALTACGKSKGGGGNQLAYGAQQCLNYRYDPNTGMYYDQANRPVPGCPNNGQNGYFMPPYNGMTGQNACSSWSWYYPGNWVPMNMGYGLVCVNTMYYYNYVPNFQKYYNMYGAYPSDTCQPGVNCGMGCIGGSGGTTSGGVYLGGTIGICFN